MGRVNARNYHPKEVSGLQCDHVNFWVRGDTGLQE